MPGTCAPCAPQLDVDLSAAATPAAVDVPIVLNDRWRVVDDLLQWILQYRESDPSERSTGYKARSFCGSRGGLTRCVRDYCGDVDPDAFMVIQFLPTMHPDDRTETQRRKARS